MLRPMFRPLASEAKGENVGLNISLPFEQNDNRYITRRLSFEFHYFFMRKFWFTYLAKAVVIFPGGFGTLDELFETLTLVQTGKSRARPILLFGREFWDKLIDFEHLIDTGMISPGDEKLVPMSVGAPISDTRAGAAIVGSDIVGELAGLRRRKVEAVVRREHLPRFLGRLDETHELLVARADHAGVRR